jgi:hypothetical protein
MERLDSDDQVKVLFLNLLVCPDGSGYRAAPFAGTGPGFEEAQFCHATFFPVAKDPTKAGSVRMSGAGIQSFERVDQ